MDFLLSNQSFCFEVTSSGLCMCTHTHTHVCTVYTHMLKMKRVAEPKSEQNKPLVIQHTTAV